MEVMLHFVKLGYDVSTPLNVDSRYDCIVDTGKKLVRIQIKTSHESKTINSFTFKCRSITINVNGVKTSKYSNEDVDYFATYWNGEVYLFPVNECSTEKTVHLAEKGDNPTKNWTYAEDYIASEVLKSL